MRIVTTLALLYAACPLVAADQPFFFQKGDRVMFLGDSITEQYQYSTDIELYLTTRFPDWNLHFLNAGIGGDTATGGAGRFQTHVLDEKPTAVTIDFGMNDGGYGAFNPGAAKNFAQKTEAMLEMAKKAGVRVALISPNAVDWRFQPNRKLYLETQKQFYAPLKDLAAKYQVPFVDQYAVTRGVLEKLEQEKKDKVNPFPDGVHTSSSGGLLMAHTILVGLGCPAKVSDATIDAGSKQASGERCKIENLTVAADQVTFDRTDEALPVPVQKDWLTLLPYVNNLTDFNDYGLTAKGLTRGIWGVSIGGIEVAKVSADDLEKGINLGNATTGPVWAQGQKVFDAINAKNNIVHDRFRGVVMFNAPNWLADVAKERKPQELAKRMELINQKQAEVYKLAQPQTQKFELKLLKQ
jgi:lysophospholipase L1-like esterase